MKSRILVIVLVISLALNIGALVTFGYFLLREEPAARQEKGFKTCCQGLSKEEFEKIAFLEKGMREKNQLIEERLAQKRQELLALIMEPELDTLKRDSLLSQITELQINMELISFNYICDLKKALPAENQEQLLIAVGECFCIQSDSGVCPLESVPNYQHKEK